MQHGIDHRTVFCLIWSRHTMQSDGFRQSILKSSKSQDEKRRGKTSSSGGSWNYQKQNTSEKCGMCSVCRMGFSQSTCSPYTMSVHCRKTIAWLTGSRVRGPSTLNQHHSWMPTSRPNICLTLTTMQKWIVWKWKLFWSSVHLNTSELSSGLIVHHKHAETSLTSCMAH